MNEWVLFCLGVCLGFFVGGFFFGVCYAKVLKYDTISSETNIFLVNNFKLFLRNLVEIIGIKHMEKFVGLWMSEIYLDKIEHNYCDLLFQGRLRDCVGPIFLIWLAKILLYCLILLIQFSLVNS